MQPVYKDRELQSSGVEDSTSFGISMKDSAHLMSIMRDQIYTDKILAIIREYSANAWDANRDAGRGDIPIKVTIPTFADPTLSIKDCGTGLSHDEMFTVFTQYGASTKRGSNTAVGMLGIGSKSGFAYSDSFTITSWHGGKQRIYAALLDQSERGTLNLLDEQDWDGLETGLEIKIPVKPADIPQFVAKATKLFVHFNPRPEINIALPTLPPDVTILKNGSLHTNDEDWVAVMGCIPYRVNIDQLTGTDGTPGFVSKLGGELFFNIGEVHISASREELKYSDLTKTKLVQKMHALVDEFIHHTLTTLDAGGFQPWERRLRIQVLNEMDLPIPDELKKRVEADVSFAKDEEPKTFTVTVGPKQSQTTHIAVTKDTRLLIRDDTRHLAGYGLYSFDYVIRPIDGKTLDEVKEELSKVLDKCELLGVPTMLISTLTWSPRNKFKKATAPSNKKHQVTSFVYKPTVAYYAKPASSHWDIITREPLDTDVYVVLESFHEKGNGRRGRGSFFSDYDDDKTFLEEIGQAMPPVYGYKTTGKKPFDVTTAKGVPYRSWRASMLERLLEDKKLRCMLNLHFWKTAYEFRGWDIHIDIDRKDEKTLFVYMKNKLGIDHPVCTFIRNKLKAVRQWNKLDKKLRMVIPKMIAKFTIEDPTDKEIEKLAEKYPLLFGINNISELWDKHSDVYINYIKLVDRAGESNDANQGTEARSDERISDGGVEGETLHGEGGSTELQQPSEGHPTEEVGPDRAAPVDDGNGLRLVEQPVSGDSHERDLQGQGSPSRICEAGNGPFGLREEPESAPSLLGQIASEPVQAFG